MNIKLITLTAAIAFATAMAQDNSGTAESLTDLNTPETLTSESASPEPSLTTPAPKPTPAPVVAAPQAQQAPADTAKSKKKTVHGIAYNTVGNTAADATIRNNLEKPHMMADSRLVYMEPTSSFAAVSFGSANTKFIAFENYSGLGMATFGIANKGMGLSLSYALSKELTLSETKDAYELESEDNYTVEAGDILRLRFSMPLGAIDLNASAYWLTYQDETSTSTEYKDADSKNTTDIDRDYWDLGASVFVSNDPSAKGLSWELGLNFTRHESAYEREAKTGSNTSTTETTGEDAHLYFQPSFNIGAPVLINKTARVLLGVNTRAPLVFYDEFDDNSNKNKDSYFTMGVYAEPNIFAEVKLGNCWRVFGGASYNWTVFSMESEEFITDYNDELDIVKQNMTAIRMRTGGVYVNFGTRFQYSNFALEASIENTFYNNPFSGFSDSDYVLLANFGAFIYF